MHARGSFFRGLRHRAVRALTAVLPPFPRSRTPRPIGSCEWFHPAASISRHLSPAESTAGHHESMFCHLKWEVPRCRHQPATHAVSSSSSPLLATSSQFLSVMRFLCRNMRRVAAPLARCPVYVPHIIHTAATASATSVYSGQYRNSNASGAEAYGSNSTTTAPSLSPPRRSS